MHLDVVSPWKESCRGPALACTALLLLLVPARPQDDRLVTTPPLEQVFPIEAKLGDVKLKFPVLLDSRTILGPDVVLRFVYIDTAAGMRAHGGAGGGLPGGGMGGGKGGGHHHGGGDGGGDSGNTASGGNVTDAMTDPLSSNKTTAKELHSEVWHDVDTFQQALQGANDIGTTLVYTRPGEKPHSAMIDLPDGMLLGETGGRVQVLALTEDSRPRLAGLQPGDQFLSVGGAPVATLHDFCKVYFTTAEQARKDGKPYSLQVTRPGESAPVSIQVGTPPSLMHMF